MSEPREYHTVKEFCEEVRISLRTYFRLRAAGDGPRVTTLGGKHLISEQERRRWMHANTERNWIDV